MAKEHNNSIEYFKEELENNFNFKCKKEFDLIRDGRFHRLDLVCAKNENENKETPSKIAIELESDNNFSKPQILSNKDDLKEFNRLYPQSKILHLHINDNPDFKKELNDTCEDKDNCLIEPSKNEIIEKKKLKLPTRISLSW